MTFKGTAPKGRYMHGAMKYEEKGLGVLHVRSFSGPGKAYMLFLVARFSTIQDPLNLMTKDRAV